MQPEPVKFLIDQYSPEETVTFAVMESGGGKTSLLLRAAISVAIGRPLFGLPVTQGRVTFIGLGDAQSSGAATTGSGAAS